jgi:multiple antibiotic resistance protein
LLDHNGHCLNFSNHQFISPTTPAGDPKGRLVDEPTFMIDWNEYFKLLAGLMSVVDPIGAIPIFLSVSENRTLEERQRTAWVCAIAVGVVLLGSLLAGELILRLFGISIPAFRVAGGILILLMGISMLHASPDRSRQTPEERIESYERESVAIVPLAIPLLSGPGAISAVIVYAQEKCSCWEHYVLVSMVIATVALTVLLTLWMAPRITWMLGKTGMNVVTRIMGLVIFSMAVEFIAKGLTELFPALGRTV